MLRSITRIRYSKNYVDGHLCKVNDHLEQCDGSCRIAEEDLVNMEGLPLSLLHDDEEEGLDNDYIETADQEAEEEAEDGSDKSEE